MRSLPTESEINRVIDTRGCSRNVARLHLGDTRSEGQRAYENDLAVQPFYHDGTKRPSWSALAEYAQWSWNRNPTAREHAVIFKGRDA